MDDVCKIRVEFELSDGLRKYLNDQLRSNELPPKLKNGIQSRISTSSVPFSIIHSCYLWDKVRKKQYHLPLWRILSLTTVVLPKPKPSPRNPEVEDRVQALRAKFSNIAYNKMVADLTPKLSVPLLSDNNYTMCSELRCVNKQLIMILNFIIIVSSGFAFGFFIPELLSHSDPGISTKLTCALACSLIVFFADLYFLTRNMSALEKR